MEIAWLETSFGNLDFTWNEAKELDHKLGLGKTFALANVRLGLV